MTAILFCPLIGSDVMKGRTVAGFKLKKDSGKGDKLIVINPFDSIVDEWAYELYKI